MAALLLQANNNEHIHSTTMREKANAPSTKKNPAQQTYTPLYLTPPGVSVTPDINPWRLTQHPFWGAVLEAFFPINATPKGVMINRPPLSYCGGDCRCRIQRAVVPLRIFKRRAQNEIIRAVKSALGTAPGRFSKTSAPQRGAVLLGKEDIFAGVEVDGKPLWVIVPRGAIKEVSP